MRPKHRGRERAIARKNCGGSFVQGRVLRHGVTAIDLVCPMCARVFVVSVNKIGVTSVPRHKMVAG